MSSDRGRLDDVDVDPREWSTRGQAAGVILAVTAMLSLAIAGPEHAVAGARSAWASIPPWLFRSGQYAAVGFLPGLALATVLHRWLAEPSGVEVLELDPVNHDHRHVRVGQSTWSDLQLKTPWGDDVGTGALQQITVNGRAGYELMDLRTPDDGPPTAVTTWLGGASSTELRTYRHAIVYARQRLSKQADRAMMLDANRGAIVREAAERVVVEMVRTADESGMPHGEEIQGVVDDVLGDYGLGDPLDDLDDQDDGIVDEQGDDQDENLVELDFSGGGIEANGQGVDNG